MSVPVGVSGFKTFTVSNVIQILSQIEQGDPSATEQLSMRNFESWLRTEEKCW